MMAYASRTGTLRNLAVLRARGWGLMVSAKGKLRTEGLRYCLDNGAWWAFQQQVAFDARAFVDAYRQLGAGADFVVLPDIVAGGLESLKFSMIWRASLEPMCQQLLAVQDGMSLADVAPHIGPQLGIFVGGSTDWKEKTLQQWGTLARERQAYLHVGRVNSMRRIYLCAAANAHSFDGSSVSRYSITMPLLDNARKQMDLLA